MALSRGYWGISQGVKGETGDCRSRYLGSGSVAWLRV